MNGIKNKLQSKLYLYTMNKKVFRHCYFLLIVSCFNSDKVKKLTVYFGLYKCPLHFCRRDMAKTLLKQEGLSCKKRKCHVNLDSIMFQRKLHNNFKWKINSRFTLKIPEIIRTSTFIVKKVKTASKLQIPQWAGKFESWC